MSYQPNEPIGYQPEYSGLQNLRRSLRETLSLLSFEILVIFLVLVYAVIIFIDLTTAESWEDVDDPLCIAATTREISRNATLTVLCDKVEPRDWLYTLDLVFLSVFLVEISVRIFAFGSSFFFDVMQVIDMVVVTIAFILALIPEDVLTSVSFLSVLRVVRLFRLAVIINKLQRSREAAAMRSKRAMYKRLGAPVEKVLTFLSELRSRLPKARDQENIDWMMEVIASDELYAVAEFDEDAILAMQTNGGASVETMKQYLSTETGLAARKALPEEGEEGDGTSSMKKTSTTGERNNSKADENWASAAIASPAFAARLQRLVTQETAWAFDIFDFDRACESLPGEGQGHPATLLTYFFLEQHGVFEALEIERSKMLLWLTAVDEGYARENAYHNALHAADVVANVDYFMRQPNFAKLLTPVDILCVLISALMHDMGHPGLNNTFLESTKHELAVTYNDVSVLENHHVASAFKLLNKDKACDWTKALSSDDYKDMRETVIQMVLGTDMRAHFEYLTKFKSKQAGEGFTASSEGRKDMRLLLTMALHAADIANPAKREIIATTWAKRSMVEFFHQGDMEAERGLPVSPFMDRHKVPLSATIVNCQIGFINVLVRPLLAEWAAFLGDAAERDIVLTLDATLRLWETQGTKVIDSWGDFASASPSSTGGLAPSAPKPGAKPGVAPSAHRSSIDKSTASKPKALSAGATEAKQSV